MKFAVAILLSLLSSFVEAQVVLPSCQVNATCNSFVSPGFTVGTNNITFSDGSVQTSAAAGGGGAINLTGPVTSVGAATTIVGPVPTAAVNLATVTIALALKSPLANPTFSGNVGIGTTSPDKALSVFGAANFQVTTSTFGVGGLIGSVNYTQVVSTTTPAYPYVNTVFSTVTLAANTLARNNDTIVITCFGMLAPANISRTFFISIGGVDVSSRTITANATAYSPGWITRAIITKVGSNAQIAHGFQAAGGNSGGPNGLTLTLTESSAQDILCGGSPQAAAGIGDMSFLGMTVEYKPAP